MDKRKYVKFVFLLLCTVVSLLIGTIPTIAELALKPSSEALSSTGGVRATVKTGSSITRTPLRNQLTSMQKKETVKSTHSLSNQSGLQLKKEKIVNHPSVEPSIKNSVSTEQIRSMTTNQPKANLTQSHETKKVINSMQNKSATMQITNTRIFADPTPVQKYASKKIKGTNNTIFSANQSSNVSNDVSNKETSETNQIGIESKSTSSTENSNSTTAESNITEQSTSDTRLENQPKNISTTDQVKAKTEVANTDSNSPADLIDSKETTALAEKDAVSEGDQTNDPLTDQSTSASTDVLTNEITPERQVTGNSNATNLVDVVPAIQTSDTQQANSTQLKSSQSNNTSGLSTYPLENKGQIALQPATAVAKQSIVTNQSLSTTPAIESTSITSKSNSDQSEEKKEIEEDRSKYSQTFLNPDGSFTTKVSLDPINYQDSTGKWQPINSDLQLNSDGTYHNSANNFDISLPSNSSEGKMKFAVGSSDISFSPTFAQDVPGSKNKNKFEYDDITTDTNLTYDITPNGLKESIVLKSSKTPNSFSFNLDMTGLTYQTQPDGSVAFYKSGGNTPIFYLEKPYMFDSNGETSSAVSYQFRTDATGKTFIDLIADSTWIHDNQRLFPIIIDPSFSTDNAGTYNSMVASKYPSGVDDQQIPFYQYSNLLVGNSVNKGITRPLYKFTLPTIPTGSVITSANLNLDNTGLSDVNQSPTVEVHRILTAWDSHNVSWTNQPTIGAVDATYLVDNQTVPYGWTIPITGLVKDWYNGVQANNGLELKYTDESLVCRELLANADTQDAIDHPFLTINFSLDGMGAEPFWTMDGPVNMANMNLVLPATDINYAGRRVNVTLDRTYNSRLKDKGVFGYGWTSPLDMKLYAAPNGKASLFGSSGTTYYFDRDTNGNYISPLGMYYSLSVSGSSATISTPDKTSYTFKQDPNNSDEYTISKVSDLAGNGLTFGYNSSNQIDSISDGAGNEIKLTYNTNDLLYTATDPAGRVWYYGYDSSYNLFKVTEPDGTTVQYSYDGNHDMVSSTSADGRINYYGYASDTSDSKSMRINFINQTNILPNGNFEVSSGGDNKPNFFYFDNGYDTGKENTNTVNAKFGKTSFEIDTSSTNSSNYASYTTGIISLKPSTYYTLSGYLKANQTTGTQSTVLSIYAYDSNFKNLGEVQRSVITSTSDYQRILKTFSSDSLPTGTWYIRVRLAASTVNGSGTSYFDGVQLEEGSVANSFVTGDVYTYWPPNMQTASYDGDGRKRLYTYNDSQNLINDEVDPNGTPTPLDLVQKNTWTSNTLTTLLDPKGNTWTNSYDPTTGNLLSSTNPNNVTTSYQYDSNSDIISETTQSGGVNTYTYDDVNNLLTSHDSEGTSVQTNPDTYGNIWRESNAVNTADNLIDNSNFEQGTTEYKFIQGLDGTWGVTTDYATLGKNAMMISSNSANSSVYTVVASDPEISVTTGAYTLSGDLKTVATSGDTQKAVLSVLAYDNTDKQIGELGNLSVQGNVDWQHLSIILVPNDFPTGTVSVRVKVGASNTDGSGVSYFDAIQFRRTTVDTSYNLIDNANFERADSSGTFPKDWLKSDSGTDSWVTSPSYDGGHALAISNANIETGVHASNYQDYNPSQTYTLTAMVETQGLTSNVAHVRIGEYDSNYNVTGYVDSPDDLGGTTDWTLMTATLQSGEAAANTVFIRPILVTGNANGSAYFDDVRLAFTDTDNLVDNADFERNDSTGTFPSGWIKSDSGTDQWDSSSKHGGGHSVSISDATNETAIRSSTFQQYDPAQTYWLTAFVKTQDLSSNVAHIRIDEYDSNYNEIGYVDSPGDLGGTTDWTMMTVTLNKGAALANTAYIRPALETGNASGTVYFDAVRLVSSSQGFIHYWYDSTGTRITSVQDQLGYTTKYLYDSLGNITSSTDPLNNLVTKKYDPKTDLLSTETLPGNDVITSYSYDNDGNLKSITATDPNQMDTIYHSTSFGYDKQGQRTSLTDGLNRTTSYDYTPAGLLQDIIVPTGSYDVNSAPTLYNIVSYTYDNAGRMQAVNFGSTGGASTTRYSYTYDKNSNITSVKDQLTGITYSIGYDSANRETSWTNGTGSLTYDLNNSGDIKKQTLNWSPTGETFSQSASFNVLDQMMNLVDINNGDNRFLFNEMGKLSMIKYANGTIATFKYDIDGELIQVQNKSSNGDLINSYLYSYNAGHQVTSITDNTCLTVYYTYTSKGQLQSETLANGDTITYSYVYDPIKNPYGDISQRQETNGTNVVSTTDYSYDKGNQITDINGKNYTYDNAGNLLSNGTYSYVWDAGGRLTEVDNSAGKVATYQYDNQNRRVQQTQFTNGTISSVTNYLYNGNSNDVVAESDATGNLQKYYTWGPSGLMGITTFDSLGKHAYYAVKNAHGDIVQLQDASGNPVATYTYDTWGNLIDSWDPNNINNPYLYAGYRYDSYDGLYYLMARYYDPSTGHFLSKDPESSTPNYAYGGNNPISFVDPTGLKVDETGNSGGGGRVGGGSEGVGSGEGEGEGTAKGSGEKDPEIDVGTEPANPDDVYGTESGWDSEAAAAEGGETSEGTTADETVNRSGKPYPDVDVEGLGKVPLPKGSYKPNNSVPLRKVFTTRLKADFKSWWEGKGRPWPEGKVEIHHIKPLSKGGTNDFDNLVPLDPATHQLFTSWWRSFP